METPQRVLLVVRLETQFRELSRVALLIRKSGQFEPCFYLDRPKGESCSKIPDACHRLGIPFELPLGIVAPPQASQATVNAAAQTQGLAAPYKRRFHFRIPLLWILSRLRKMMRKGRREVHQVREYLRSNPPVLVIVPEDGVGGPLYLVHAARSLNIPVLIVPYEFSSLKQPVQAILDDPSRKDYLVQSLQQHWVARRYPAWAVKWQNLQLLRMPLLNIITMETLGIAPIQPWAVHGGRAHFLAVESLAMHRHYLKLGLPAEKLVLTGALSDDNLHQHLEHRCDARRALLREWDWPENVRVLLCCLPPDYTSKRESCFSNYEDLLRFWISSLDRLENYKVLYQLHPAVNETQKKFIATLGVPVTRQDPAALIPCCDALITSVSSIIRWAIACGKPVINFDVYRFGYDDYTGTPGVVTIDEPQVFEAELTKLASEAGHLDSLAAMQQAIAGEWGMLDGLSGTRMLEVMVRLVQAHRPSEHI